jgi:hypothetical protein
MGYSSSHFGLALETGHLVPDGLEDESLLAAAVIATRGE